MSIYYKINYTDIKQIGSSDEMSISDINDPIILNNDILDESIYINIFHENRINEGSLKWGAVHLNQSNIDQLVDILFKFSLLDENNCDFILPIDVNNQIREDALSYKQAIKNHIEENYINPENGIVLITYGDNQIAGYYNWRVIDSIEWIIQETDLDDEEILPIENNGKKWIDVLDYFKNTNIDREVLQFLANKLCIEDDNTPERTLGKLRILFINSLCSFSKILIDDVNYKDKYNEAFNFNMQSEGVDVGMAIWDDILDRSKKISSKINMPTLICLDKTLSSQDYHFQNGFRPLVPGFNRFNKDNFESLIHLENNLQKMNVEELNDANEDTENIAVFKYVNSTETLKSYDINLDILFLDLNLDEYLSIFDKDALKLGLKSLLYFAIDPRIIGEIFDLGDAADPVGTSTLYFYESINNYEENDEEILDFLTQDFRDSPLTLEKILENDNIFQKKRSYSDFKLIENEKKEKDNNRSQSMPDL